MDLLTAVAVELPCQACGGMFHVSLGQVLIAQEGLHLKCDARGERECPEFHFAGLIDEKLASTLAETWRAIEAWVTAEGGRLVVLPQPDAQVADGEQHDG